MFAEFLEHEFSVENLFFWRDVQTYKSGAAEALDIYYIYIHPNSPLCVNIAGSTRIAITKNLGIDELEHRNYERFQNSSQVSVPPSLAITGKPSVMAKLSAGILLPELDLLARGSIDPAKQAFDAAADDVLRLMFRDSFGRFRAQGRYKKFLRSTHSSARSSNDVSASSRLQRLDSITFGAASSGKGALQVLLISKSPTE